MKINKKGGLEVNGLIIVAVLAFVLFGTKIFDILKNPVVLIIALVVFWAFSSGK